MAGFEKGANESGLDYEGANGYVNTSGNMSSAIEDKISGVVSDIMNHDSVVDIDACADDPTQSASQSGQVGVSVGIGSVAHGAKDSITVDAGGSNATAADQIVGVAAEGMVDPNTAEASDDKTEIGNGNEHDYGFNDVEAQRREQREMRQTASDNPSAASTPVSGGTQTAAQGAAAVGASGAGAAAGATGASVVAGATSTGVGAGGAKVTGAASAVAAAAAGGINVQGGWTSHADLPDGEGDFITDTNGFDITQVSTELELPDGEVIDMSELTEDDIKALLGEMSQEEYDEFIKNLVAYYEKNIGDYNTLLNGDDTHPGIIKLLEILETEDTENIINLYEIFLQDFDHMISICIQNDPQFNLEDLNINPDEYEKMSREEKMNALLDALARREYTGDNFDSLSVDEKIALLTNSENYEDTYLYNFVEYYNLYQERTAEINEYMNENYSDLQIFTYKDYVSAHNSLLTNKSEIEEAIKTTYNMMDSAQYDYLVYLKEYAEYDYHEPTAEEIADLDNFKSDGRSGRTYDYEAYHKAHPNITPMTFIKMVRDRNKGSGLSSDYIHINGIDNISELSDLIEAAEAYPDYAKAYDYIYTHDGPQAAKTYLEKCKYEINNVRGQLAAQEFLSTLYVSDGEGNENLEAIANALNITPEALLDGLDTFVEGGVFTMEALLTALGIMPENRVLSVQEYKKMYILQALMTQEQKAAAGLITYVDARHGKGKYVNNEPSIIDFTIQYSGGELLKHIYTVGQGIGNMLPSMAISAVCPLAGSVAMGISAGGNAYHQAMVEGQSLASSIFYGIFTGSSEAISERILGGLPFLSDVNVNSLYTYFKAAGREGFQEMFQEIMDISYQWTIMGKDPPKTEKEWIELFEEIKWSGIYGAVTAGIMQMPSLVTAAHSLHAFKVYIEENGITQEQVDAAILELKNNNPELAELSDRDIKISQNKSLQLITKRNQLMQQYNINQTAANMMMNDSRFTAAMAMQLTELMDSGLTTTQAIEALQAIINGSASADVAVDGAEAGADVEAELDSGADEEIDSPVADEDAAANDDSEDLAASEEPTIEKTAQDLADEKGISLAEAEHILDVAASENISIDLAERLIKAGFDSKADLAASLGLKSDTSLEKLLNVHESMSAVRTSPTHENQAQLLSAVADLGLTSTDIPIDIKTLVETTFNSMSQDEQIQFIEEIGTDQCKTLVDCQSVEMQGTVAEMALRTKAAQYGYSEDKVNAYIALLQGDIRWATNNSKAEILAELESDPLYQTASPSEQEELYNERLLQATSVAEASNYIASLQVLEETRNRFDNGYYTDINPLTGEPLTLDDLLQFKLDGRDKNIQTPQKDYAGIEHSEYLPPADCFISDERVLAYVKEICPDPRVQSATSLAELAEILYQADEAGDPIVAQYVTFQNAATGANNISSFGAFGDIRYNMQQAGPFAVPLSALETYAQQYPEYCSYNPETKEFTITNMEKFGSVVLSGVPLSDSGTYMIVTTVPLNSQTTSMPSVDNASSYPAYFVPGGKLLSGQTEIVILQSKCPETGRQLIASGTDSGTFTHPDNTSDLNTDIGYVIITLKQGTEADALASLSATVRESERTGTPLSPELQSKVDAEVDNWSSRVNDPNLTTDQVLEVAATASELMQTLGIEEPEAIALAKLYAEGMDAASSKYIGFFKNFREHAKAHTLKVTEYALELAKGLPNVDMNEVKYAALCHDLGMKGGLKVVENNDGTYDFVQIDAGADLENLSASQSAKLANQARKNHPLNSAIAVLSEDVLPDGVDADVVALLAMSHSKSTSGIRHFSSQQEWLGCVSKLEAAVATYNQEFGTNIKFDGDKLRAMINDPAEFTRLQNEALVVRDGDAMSKIPYDSQGRMTMQTGAVSEVQQTNPRLNYNDEIASSFRQELINQGVTDTITYEDGTQTTLDPNNPNDAFSMKVHVGENNLIFSSSFSDTADGRTYQARITPINANDSPNCTLQSIEERLGEVATYDNCEYREFVIVLPADAEGTNLGQWYEREVAKIKAKKFDAIQAEAHGMTLEQWYQGGKSQATELSASYTPSTLSDLNFYSGGATTGSIRIIYEGA